MPEAKTTSTTSLPFIDPVMPLAQNLATIWRSEPSDLEVGRADELAGAISQMSAATTDGALVQLALAAQTIEDLKEVLFDAANIDGLGAPEDITDRASRLISSAIATMRKAITVENAVEQLLNVYVVAPTN